MSDSRPRKRFGQHFLADRGAVSRIVDLLAPDRDEPVLEIGPGRGVLTAALLQRVDSLGAVEIDRDLADALSQRFAGLRLFRGDVLDHDLETLRADLAPGTRRLAVAGNLPYNISKPIAMKLIDQRHAVDRAVLMFQREVATRLTARSGGRDYGPLSVLAGLAYDIRRAFDLPPGAFRPRPAVHSTVTVWTARRAGPLDGPIGASIRPCLAACFARRRQTLRNNLRAALRDATRAEDVLRRAGLDPAARAEAIDPEGFLRLAEVWPGLPGSSAPD